MALEYNGNLYAVGVGDFIAYKGGQFAAMGKVATETTFDFSASNLDIKGGKRNPLLFRYFHSPEATFSIIAANYNPELWRATSGGTDISYANLPKEETLAMSTRTITLSETPVEVGDISASVWVKYEGIMYSPITASSTTVVIPSDGVYADIPNGATVCVTYNYKNINATGVTIPANIQPEIWHIFVDIDIATDKSGSGIVGRTVLEIPLAQLDPAQTLNATADGYSESKLTGIMLADKTGVGCTGTGVYAYLSTELFNTNWYDSVTAVVNDPDDVSLGNSESYTIKLIGLQHNGTYLTLDSSYFADLTFTFDDGTATGTTFNSSTGVITTSTVDGTATLEVSITAKTSVSTYTLEIVVA